MESNNSEYSNTIKFIGSDTNKNALIRIYRKDNDSGLGSGAYLSLKVKRDDTELHIYSETGDNDDQTEVLEVWNDLQPKDIIE